MRMSSLLWQRCWARWPAHRQPSPPRGYRREAKRVVNWRNRKSRKRETLYGEFITEAARLLSDAFDHTLDNPETLVKLYAILGRIRLASSEAVFNAAEECSSRILDVYATPNRTVDELIGAIRSDEMAFLRKFSDACRVELRKYSQY
jgi:hypothetical protein